jgi:excisionase family DNA binding protein
MPKTEVTAAAHGPHHTLATPLPQLAYGIDAAADTLDLSRSKIYELIAAGEIAACKVGKRTIIQAAELTAFLERHRVARLSSVTTAPSTGAPVMSPPASPSSDREETRRLVSGPFRAAGQ